MAHGMKASKHHHSAHTGMGKPTAQAGGNLKLPKPSQAMHVSQTKDTMAGNVGGSAAHMGAKNQFGPRQKVMMSGAREKKVVGDRY